MAWRLQKKEVKGDGGDRVLQTLKKYGVAYVRNVINMRLCERILQELSCCLEDPDAKLGAIQAPHRRLDIPIPLSKNVCVTISQIIEPWLERCWNELVPNLRVVECGAFVAWSGAAAQPWHRDTTWNLTDATLITIAVALSEVSPRSGPTEFILGSHSFLGDLPSEEHQSSSHEMACAAVGDIYMWNSLIVHRGNFDELHTSTARVTHIIIKIGGKHRSVAPRPIFYFSIISSKGTRPKGGTYTLHPDYGDSVSLTKLRSIVQGDFKYYPSTTKTNPKSLQFLRPLGEIGDLRDWRALVCNEIMQYIGDILLMQAPYFGTSSHEQNDVVCVAWTQVGMRLWVRNYL